MKSSRTSTKISRPNKTKAPSQVPKAEEIQGSQGDLNNQKNDNVNQSSQGDLKNGSHTEFSNFKKSVESVPISNILHFSSIPDFVDRTISPYPIVVNTPSAVQCVDGWELIDEARHRGEQQIVCEIIHTDQDSEIEVALWKISARMRPPGGRCSYAEAVRNVRQIFTKIQVSQEDPKIYAHGGDRRSQDFIDNNREENIRILLERRLGKKVKTINKYLNHSEFLDDNTLDVLIRSEIKKDFFEKAQPKKRIFIRNLKGDGSSDETITTEASQKMASWLQEYQTTGDISWDDLDPGDNDLEGGNNGAGEEIIGSNQSNTLKTFTPWPGRGETGPLTPPSEDDIKRTIDMATIPLIRCRNRSPMDLEFLISKIPVAIDHLVQVNKMAMYIRNNKSKDKEV